MQVWCRLVSKLFQNNLCRLNQAECFFPPMDTKWKCVCSGIHTAGKWSFLEVHRYANKSSQECYHIVFCLPWSNQLECFLGYLGVLVVSMHICCCATEYCTISLPLSLPGVLISLIAARLGIHSLTSQFFAESVCVCQNCIGFAWSHFLIHCQSIHGYEDCAGIAQSHLMAYARLYDCLLFFWLTWWCWAIHSLPMFLHFTLCMFFLGMLRHLSGHSIHKLVVSLPLCWLWRNVTVVQ